MACAPASQQPQCSSAGLSPVCQRLACYVGSKTGHHIPGMALPLWSGGEQALFFVCWLCACLRSLVCAELPSSQGTLLFLPNLPKRSPQVLFCKAAACLVLPEQVWLCGLRPSRLEMLHFPFLTFRRFLLAHSFSLSRCLRLFFLSPPFCSACGFPSSRACAIRTCSKT